VAVAVVVAVTQEALLEGAEVEALEVEQRAAVAQPIQVAVVVVVELMMDKITPVVQVVQAL
jgi:hypothetical protein